MALHCLLRSMPLRALVAVIVVSAGWPYSSHAFDREAARHDLEEALNATLELIDEVVVENKEGANIRRRWMVLLQPRVFAEFEIVHRCQVKHQPGARQISRFRFTTSPVISPEDAAYNLARKVNFFQNLVKPGDAPPFDRVVLVFEVDERFADHEFWIDRHPAREWQPAGDSPRRPPADIAVENTLSTVLEIEHVSAHGFFDAAGRPMPIEISIVIRALSPGRFNLVARVEDTTIPGGKIEPRPIAYPTPNAHPGAARKRSGIPLVIVGHGVRQHTVIEPANIVRIDGEGRQRFHSRLKILPTATVLPVGETFRKVVGGFAPGSPHDAIRVELGKAPFRPVGRRVGDLIPWKDY